MRQLTCTMLVFVTLIAGAPAIGSPNVVGAAEATPPATAASSEGVTFEMLTFALVETLPPAPAAMVLQRYRLEPGAVQAAEATDPSLAFIYQESGTAIIRLAASILITRAGATPGEPDAQEEIPADTEFAFGPGDSFAWPPFVAGEVRNEGTETAAALVVIVAPQEAATPTP